MAPTPYPDVDAVLSLLLAGVQALLGRRFVGMYLYGSLASGDFDPQRSDIDFVVVVDEELPAPLLPQLAALHARLAASGMPWAAKLEGSYIPQAALRRYTPADPPRPTINEGRFYLAPHASDWVMQRVILRAQGVVVAGPALAPLIDPVPPQELRRAVAQLLAEWWAPMLRDSSRLGSREYQAYAVLTLCRALYTLAHAEIVSKPAAARWAQAALEERWAALIERAIGWQAHDGVNDLQATLEFLRFALKEAGSPDANAQG